jgi:hypothetical protein
MSTLGLREPPWAGAASVLGLALGGLAAITVGALLHAQVAAFGGAAFVLLSLHQLRALARARRELARRAAATAGELPAIGLDHAEVVAIPEVVATRYVAVAVDAARRGDLALADDAIRRVERALVARDDLRLLAAARALVCLGLGDEERAARLAVLAVPTRSDELDARLARSVVARAWAEPPRLAAIDRAWAEAGVLASRDDVLGRLRRLCRVRLDPSLVDEIAPREAELLAEEARAMDDHELAGRLRGRAARSRGYR